jgi:signal transduction histidine kinase
MLKTAMDHPVWRRLVGRREGNTCQEFVSSFASLALGILDPGERKAFMESEIMRAFGFRRVEILSRPEGSERFTSESTRVRGIIGRVLGMIEGTGTPFLNGAVANRLGVPAILRDFRATYAFPVRQRDAALGLILIDSTPRTSLGAGVENSMIALTNQIALVLENSNLLKSKLELQHTLAAQSQMVQLGEMTARIAHEIKNPLSSIKTIVQLMQEDREVSARYAQDLELVRAEIDRLASTVAQLLNFARPAADPQEPVRLRDIASAVIAFLHHDIAGTGIEIANDIPADLPAVTGSPTAFREVFLNLLLNAMQAADEKTSLVRLSAWEGILEDGSDSYVLLVVEDDGPGISAPVQERVFAPFFTTRQRGTGLGLSIVKRDIEHAGGRITLESPAHGNRGTRFLMHLPLGVEASEAGAGRK